jgi:hypothetical protein
MKKILLSILMLVVMMGCVKPYKQELFYDSKPNEQIYLIAMEDDVEDQGTFNTRKDKAYYDKAMVMSTRVNIRQRWKQEGRLEFSGQWIQSDKLLAVDLTPVSRKWTADIDTGTTTANQGFSMESADSISFTIGGVCTARIYDGSLYLASYGESNSLSKTIDSNIRTAFETELNKGFSALELSEGRSSKNEISKLAAEITTTMFRSKGIEIETLGLTGGMLYEDKKIQENINAEFASTLQAKIKLNERLAQKEVNLQEIAQAETAKAVAIVFAQTSKIQSQMVQLEIAKIDAESRKIWAQKWSGQLPEKILPEGSNLMLNME